MRKTIAIVCACLCLGLAVTAYAENDGDTSVESVVSQETVTSTEETVSEDETIGADGETVSESDGETDETVSEETVSDSQSQEESVESVESSLPVGTVSDPDDDGYNIVDEKDIIVNYASSEEELPHIGILIWSICGVLLAGCAIIFVYKFVKWRQSK